MTSQVRNSEAARQGSQFQPIGLTEAPSVVSGGRRMSVNSPSIAPITNELASQSSDSIGKDQRAAPLSLAPAQSSHSVSPPSSQGLSTRNKIGRAISNFFSGIAKGISSSLKESPEKKLDKAKAGLIKAQQNLSDAKFAIPHNEGLINKATTAFEKATAVLIIAEEPFVKAALMKSPMDIEALLNTIDGRKSITNFLKERYSDETLMCFDDINNLNELIKKHKLNEDNTNIMVAYEELIDKYVRENSPKQVNIGSLGKDVKNQTTPSTLIAELNDSPDLNGIKRELNGLQKQMLNTIGREYPTQANGGLRLKNTYEIT